MILRNPATQEVLEERPACDASQVREAWELAHSAQKDWKQKPLSHRIKCLEMFRHKLYENRETLARTLSQEMGKPLTQSHNEINAVSNRIEFFVNHVEHELEHRMVYRNPDSRIVEKIIPEPLGVIAHISPWNYPYFVGANIVVPALLTGNAVLYKPSEYATRTGLAIAHHLHESGIPESVFICLPGDAETGSALVDLPLQGIFFTGSFATGKVLSQKLAGRFLKVQMELGGKDPAYCCDDVDIALAAQSLAEGVFYNAGQSCCAVERLYVHEKIFAPFVEAFIARVKNMVVGDPMDPKTFLGPLARPQQIPYLEKQIADALSKNAQCVLGGKAKPPGNYFEPTLLLNVNHTMSVMREETFGPVIGIQKVSSDQEACALMNDSEYGLTASVYSQSLERATHILGSLETGTAYWNCCDRVSPRLPWSGRRHSGIGVTLGSQGIAAFVHARAWHLSGPSAEK